MKKNEERSRPEAIQWKEVKSDLKLGESTATSEEDTEEAIYEGRVAVSDSDDDILGPKKIRRISDVMEAPSDKLPGEFCHIRQSIK